MEFSDFYEMDAMKYYDKSDDSKLSANLLTNGMAIGWCLLLMAIEISSAAQEVEM